MVLFFFCRLFFAPPGQKITYKGKEIRGLRKSYIYKVASESKDQSHIMEQ